MSSLHVRMQTSLVTITDGLCLHLKVVYPEFSESFITVSSWFFMVLHRPQAHSEVL